MTADDLALASVAHLARFAVAEAAREGRRSLPATHPAKAIDALPHTSPDARDEAIARAWFRHLAGLKEKP